MPFYGQQNWDPKLICAQIVAIQVIFLENGLCCFNAFVEPELYNIWAVIVDFP